MFGDCLDKTLKYEGVYSNHPLDSGGETYRGIARNYHPKWAGWKIIDNIKHHKGLAALEERNKELNVLVATFYREKFWNKINGSKIEQIDGVLACNVFDFAVNAGNKRAKKVLQKALNRVFRQYGYDERVVEDGIIGPITLRYLQFVKDRGFRLLDAFKIERSLFYIKLVKKRPKQIAFLSGWIARTISA